MSLRRTIEAEIVRVEGRPREVDVITRDTQTRRLPYLEVAHRLSQNRFKRGVGVTTSLILGITAVTKFSEGLFPLISQDLRPLNTYPILTELSNIAENPTVIGIVTALGSYYVGKSVFRHRYRDRVIQEALSTVEVSGGGSHQRNFNFPDDRKL